MSPGQSFTCSTFPAAGPCQDLDDLPPPKWTEVHFVNFSQRIQFFFIIFTVCTHWIRPFNQVPSWVELSWVESCLPGLDAQQSSVSVSVCVCVRVHIHVHIHVHLRVQLSVKYPTLKDPLSLFLLLPLSLFLILPHIDAPTHHSHWLTVCLSVGLYACLSLPFSVRLSVRLSLQNFIRSCSSSFARTLGEDDAEVEGPVAAKVEANSLERHWLTFLIDFTSCQN